MRMWVLTGATIVAAALATGPASARQRYFVPEPGDTSLASKCRSEASMMGGRGGRGVVMSVMEVREMRHAYFRKCMGRA